MHRLVHNAVRKRCTQCRLAHSRPARSAVQWVVLRTGETRGALHDLRFGMSVYDMLGGEVIACNGPRTRALGPSRGASTARASCARVGGNRRPPQSSSAGSGRPHSTVGRWKSGSSRHSSGGSNGGGVASGCLVEPMSTLILARARVGHYRNCRNSSPAPRAAHGVLVFSSSERGGRAAQRSAAPL